MFYELNAVSDTHEKVKKKPQQIYFLFDQFHGANPRSLRHHAVSPVHSS
jgi:hypothetical protein